MWSLPYEITIGDDKHPIRQKGDYRVILDATEALKDTELTPAERNWCAFAIFYEDINQIKDYIGAVTAMHEFLNNGESSSGGEEPQTPLVDFKHDWKLIAPAVSRVLGYEIRDPDKFTHWQTFLGAYMDLPPECLFQRVLCIRSKLRKGIELDKGEQEFYIKNPELIILPNTLTEEEQAYLDSDW